MKNSLQKIATGITLASTFILINSQASRAISVKATVTADNFYGLFYGSEDASSLNYIGRNETGDKGTTGQYNWSAPETWDFDVSNDDYVYIATWDDASVAAAWLGEFKVGGETIFSSSDDWEYIFHEDNPFTQAGNPVPGGDELASAIHTGGWLEAETVGKNGVNPWGKIADIDGEANWLKTTELGADMYTIFRTKVSITETASVPEPASVLGLLALGAIGTATLRKRNQMDN